MIQVLKILGMDLIDQVLTNPEKLLEMSQFYQEQKIQEIDQFLMIRGMSLIGQKLEIQGTHLMNHGEMNQGKNQIDQELKIQGKFQETNQIDHVQMNPEKILSMSQMNQVQRTRG